MLKCKFAWDHLDFLQGQYAPCFRYKTKRQPIARMSDTLPSEAINCENMKQVRAALQRGKFPAGCEDCAYKEKNGIKSYRQKSLGNKGWDDSNIDYNSTVIPGVSDLELKFSRTCNFFCRHCMAESNSRFEILGKNNPEINDKLQELNFDHLGIADSPIETVSVEHLEDIIKNVLPSVKRITISGGEPLYHLDHYRFLERLITDNTVDTRKISLTYNTNMSMINFKSYRLSDLWKEFKNIDLTVSLDGTGELFNYFREGGDYDTVVENIFTIIEECDNIRSIYLVCTSTAYHAFYADKIFKDLNELAEKIKEKNVYAHSGATFVHYPNGLDIANLEQSVKDKLLEEMPHDNPIIEYMKTPQYSDSTFREIVKLQDKLHNKKCTLDKISDYVYKY